MATSLTYKPTAHRILRILHNHEGITKQTLQIQSDLVGKSMCGVGGVCCSSFRSVVNLAAGQLSETSTLDTEEWIAKRKRAFADVVV